MRFTAGQFARVGGVPAMLVAALAAVPSSGWAQCSVCQAALAGAENGSQLIGGFQQGIALMFAVMAVLGVLAWRITRRVRSEFAIRKSQYSHTAPETSSCLPAENPASR